MARPLTVLLLVVGACLGGCSSGSSTEGTSTAAAASSSGIPMIKLTDKRFGPPRVGARKNGGAKIVASSLPVAEDYESEFKKQITSSNYLDALNSAAAEASAAPSAHP